MYYVYDKMTVPTNYDEDNLFRQYYTMNQLLQYNITLKKFHTVEELERFEENNKDYTLHSALWSRVVKDYESHIPAVCYSDDEALSHILHYLNCDVELYNMDVNLQLRGY